MLLAHRNKGVLGLHSDEGLLQPGSTASSGVRTGATARGLPGGQGVWGTLAPEGSEGALWHRAERPAVADATGAQPHEIQVTLADAWDRGHDAVMLRNYTRPGGKTPENVVVVRDANQLRSPSAAFDPSRKLDRNLLAGVTGAGAVGLAAGAPNDAKAGTMPDDVPLASLVSASGQPVLPASLAKILAQHGAMNPPVDPTGPASALARLLAPNITSALSGEGRAAPPPDITGMPPGKVPSADDPRIAGSVPEVAGLVASAIPGLGAAGGAGMRGAEAAAPAVAGRVAPTAAGMSGQDLAGIMGAAENMAPTSAEAAPRPTREQQRLLEVERLRGEMQAQQAAQAQQREQQARVAQSQQEIERQKAQTQADIEAKAAQAQAARDEQQKQQNQPFREKYQELARILPFLGGAASLLLPIGTQIAKIPGQNALTKQWTATADGIETALAAGDHKAATRGLNQLAAYGEQWKKANSGVSPGVYAGAASGPTEAALMPAVYDSLTLPPGDKNQPDWEKIAKDRLPVAIGEGLALGSAGAKIMPKRNPAIVARSEGLLASYPNRAGLDLNPPGPPPPPASLALTQAEQKHLSANQDALTAAVPSARLRGDRIEFDPQHTGHFIQFIDDARAGRQPGTRLPPSYYKTDALGTKIQNAPPNYQVEPYRPTTNIPLATLPGAMR
jgi:hypothetical protein